MALKRVTISGVIICCVLYAIFHNEVKTPQQNCIGTWKSQNNDGNVTLTLQSNYTFDCDIYSKKVAKNIHYKGFWEITGLSNNSETEEPPDAMLKLISSNNQELINHRVKKINEHQMLLQNTTENNALTFNR